MPKRATPALPPPIQNLLGAKPLLSVPCRVLLSVFAISWRAGLLWRFTPILSVPVAWDEMAWNSRLGPVSWQGDRPFFNSQRSNHCGNLQEGGACEPDTGT